MIHFVSNSVRKWLQYFVCHPSAWMQASILLGILWYKLSNRDLSNVSYAACKQLSRRCLEYSDSDLSAATSGNISQNRTFKAYPQTIVFMFLFVPYVWTILGSHFCRGVRKHHSSLLPRPRSTEHSSLQATIPHSSSFQCLLFKHQASLFCACSNVSNGRRLHFQLVMPWHLRIFLIVVVEIVT
jgi:hypothetical protein